jgi:acetolactate decarboxylase
MRILYTLIAMLLLGCISKPNYPDIQIIGAMKNVMWDGELFGKINLDTISNKKGLYGLGPESYLTGELLINNGKSYVSKVISDTSMHVIERFDVSAPFFVYAYVTKWKELVLPPNIKNISDLESFIDSSSTEYKRPFAFKLIGKISSATIHIQNLPKGTKVSSPKEAHQGQINYKLENEEAEIIGFFSTNHKGIFTHHDSFLHMHLITKDESKMGHLDKLEIQKMKLYLPQY